MTKTCVSNCNSQSLKLYFTLVTQGVMDTERTYLESPDLYANQDGFLDLTKEVRMFVSILENPEIKFIVEMKEPKKELCDICFTNKVDAQ